MALISCTECGKEVSDKASSCPGCGAPIALSERTTPAPQQHVKVTRSGGAWEGVGFLAIVAGVIAAFATDDGNHVGAILIVVGFVVFLVGRFK